MNRLSIRRPASILALSFLSLCAATLAGCRKTDNNANAPSVPTVDISFVYGSEKQAWIADVTDAFNRSQPRTAGGKVIQVTLLPMGSGETIDKVLSGEIKADVISPASRAFITLGNARSRSQGGSDLVESTQSLVLSPVVIAMWRPMAEALGWPGTAVGWADVLSLAKNPQGWAAYGHPEWGKFKFGHTHPEYSNSGLISVLAEAYAGSGKTSKLTSEDLAKPEVGQYIETIESAVVHYGSSTGFFSDRMFAGGPGYLSAAVMYENLVIDSYKPGASPHGNVVAIYPKEGTFWSDHPVGVVHRDWVTPERREAVEAYVKFLLDRPQQEKALAFGFRPGDPAVALASPIDAPHGVDPQQPRTVLDVPPADVVHEALNLWRAHKKHANIVLCLDTSGSMDDDNKLASAKEGAKLLLATLDGDDTVSVLHFSSGVQWVGDRGRKLKDARQSLTQGIDNLIADGETPLFDAVSLGYRYVAQENFHPEEITAVVVLTDGMNNQGISEEQLLAQIRQDNERQGVRVFTIGYGKDADEAVLKRIADATHAKYSPGTPEKIKDVFKEIATFF